MFAMNPLGTVYKKTIRVATDESRRNVYIEVELRDRKGDGNLELAMSGFAQKNRNSDYSYCGQIEDTILDGLKYGAKSPMYPKIEYRKLRRMLTVWKRWHLNCMRPGCEHQMKAIREKREQSGTCPECGYEYGSEWKSEPLPAEIAAEVRGW